MKKSVAALLLAMSALSSVHAEDKLTYDRVAFNVQAEKDVANDVLTAVLYAEQQGQDTAALADTVNKAINWAMELAKQESAVEARTLDYTTAPVYTDNRVTGWQVRQSIQLKSKDSQKLSALLGKLQEKLRIDSLSYTVSPEVQATTEEELIGNALANFKKRAEQVKTTMGRSNFKIVRLDIQSLGDTPNYPMYRMAAADMAGAPAPAAPTLESGKQKLRVQVNAEIELSLN